MNRQTLERLKEHLLKRLVEGEIDKTLYDRILAELEAFPLDSERESPESFAWEEKFENLARQAGKTCGKIAEKVAGAFSFDRPEPEKPKEKPEFPYSGSKDNDDLRRMNEKIKLSRRLRLLSLFVLIHAVNAILFGVLHVFEVWHRSSVPFGCLSIVAGAAMLATGYCMREMRHYTYVWWSLFLFLTPIFGLWPLGLLIGVVGLILLSDGNAEEAFFPAPVQNETSFEKRTYKETAEERRERKRLRKYS